jgi:hypothetical protein
LTYSYFKLKPPRDVPGGFNSPVRRSTSAAAAEGSISAEASSVIGFCCFACLFGRGFPSSTLALALASHSTLVVARALFQ